MLTATSCAGPVSASPAGALCARAGDWISTLTCSLSPDPGAGFDSDGRPPLCPELAVWEGAAGNAPAAGGACEAAGASLISVTVTAREEPSASASGEPSTGSRKSWHVT